MPYRLMDRWADARQGRRDGRKGIPALPPAPDGQAEPFDGKQETVETGRIRQLCSQAEVAMAVEQDRGSWAIAKREQARDEAHSRMETARTRLVRAERWLTDADAGADLEEHRLAELHRPAELVRNRRLSEWKRARAAAETAFFEAQRQHADAKHLLNSREREAEAARTAVRLRVAAVRAHFARRIYTYWQHVVGAHPESGRLNAAYLPAEPEPPPPAHVTDLPGEQVGSIEKRVA
jgi:hypothetical protein